MRAGTRAGSPRSGGSSSGGIILSCVPFLLLALAFVVAVPASGAELLTNEDIRSMTSTGVSPVVILAKIESSEPDSWTLFAGSRPCYRRP